VDNSYYFFGKNLGQKRKGIYQITSQFLRKALVHTLLEVSTIKLTG